MKKIYNIMMLMLIVSISSYAQLDRSVVPEAGPATVLDLGKSTSFELDNGLKVILVEDHRFPTVTYSVLLDREPIYEGDKAGYTSFAGTLMRMGTTNMSKDKIDEKIDFLGGNLVTSSTQVAVVGLKKHSDDLLDLMCDVLYNPTFPSEELEKLKTQYITGLKTQEQDMDEISGNVRNALMYGKESAYGEVTDEKKLNSITVEDCKDYFDTYFQPKGSYLIMVGDISKGEAKKIAKKRFAQWQAKEVPQHGFNYPAPITKPEYAIGNKTGSTQANVSVSYPVSYKPGASDISAVTVMNQVLGGGGFSARLFQNLREDKAWTYGAYSSIRTNEYLGSFNAYATVRVNVVDSAMNEIAYEMNKMRTEEVDANTLQLVKNAIAGSFARSLEDPWQIANFAYKIDKYNLPADYYEKYMERLDAVTAEDVKEAANKYLKPEHAIYLAVGDRATIEPLMEKLAGGPVPEYDFYVNKVEKAKLPSDLTARKVIDTYISALGGQEAINSVKTLQLQMYTTMQGQEITLEQTNKFPNKYAIVVNQGDTEFMRTVYNGEVAKVKMFGNSKEIEGEKLEKLKEEADFFAETKLTDSEMELTGIDIVDGSPAYIIKTDKSILYFDAKSGLLVKEESTVGEKHTAQLFGDYLEFEGVMLPTKLTSVEGDYTSTVDVNKVVINKEVEDSLFE